MAPSTRHRAFESPAGVLTDRGKKVSGNFHFNIGEEPSWSNPGLNGIRVNFRIVRQTNAG